MPPNSRYLEPYNPKATYKRYQPTQGQLAPIPKKKNPFVRPTPGGGSGPVTTTSPSSPSSANRKGANVQAAKTMPVSTVFTANYDSDPVLARIKALGQQNIGNATTEANALRKQAILDTGLTDVGREVGVDENTLAAAAGNPDSLIAQLSREAIKRESDLDESLNTQNLFYSGARQRGLGELAENRRAAETSLSRDLRSALAGIDSGLLGVQTAEALREQEAMEAVARQQFEDAQQQAFNDSLMALFAQPEEEAVIDEAPVLTPEEELALMLGYGSGFGGAGRTYAV